jgi:hypothetical protein
MEFLRTNLMLVIKRLEDLERDHAARRPVVLEGFEDADGLRLVAEFYGRASTERWWAVVRNGRAEFPALMPGDWNFILERPGGPEKAKLKVPDSSNFAPLRFEPEPR